MLNFIEHKKIKLILSSFIIVLNLAIPAYSECFEGNCYSGHGTYTFSDGNKYVGEWKNGYRDGQGTFTWANGDKYVGQWKNNKMEGYGTFTWANGDKYVGQWKNNITSKMYDKIKNSIENKINYVGNFLKNCYHPTSEYIENSLKILDITQSGVIVKFSYKGLIGLHEMQVYIFLDGTPNDGSLDIMYDTGAISGTPIGHVNYCHSFKSLFEGLK